MPQAGPVEQGGGHIGAFGPRGRYVLCPDLSSDGVLTGPLQEAVRLNGVARFAQSRALLDEALTAASGVPGDEGTYWRARLLITRAYSTNELIGQAAALAELQTAQDIGHRLGSLRLVALGHIQAANLFFRATDWTRAADAATAAVQAAGPLSEEESYALFLNRGFALLALRRLDEAQDDLRTARALAQSLGSPVLLFKAVHNLGCLEWVRGNLPGALALMDEANTIPADIARDRALLDQAQVLIEAGLVDRARLRLMEALATARAHDHRLEEGAIHLDLARCAIHDGDLALAREQAALAASGFEAAGADHRVRRTQLIRAAIDLATGQGVAGAEAASREWLARPGDPVEDHTATWLLAEALLARGAVAECADLVDPIAPTLPFGVVAELHEFLVRVQLADARGRAHQANRLCATAAKRLARRQAHLQSLELRAAVALHGQRLAALDISRALGSGSTAKVLRSVERWRGVSHRLPSLTPSADPVVAELIADLRRARHRSSELGEDSPARIRALEEAVTSHELRRSVADRVGEVDKPVSLPHALAAARAGGSTLVELFLNDGRLHALVIGPGGSRLGTLGAAAEIAVAAHRLAQDLRAAALVTGPVSLKDAVNGAAADALARLDDLVGRPLAALLPDHDGPVVVVPAAPLTTVAWRMLPSWHGRDVIVSPSATRWVRLVEGGQSVGDGQPPGDGRVRVLLGPGLRCAAQEADAVVRAWGGVSDGARAATSAEACAAIADGDLVHIAAHGTHQDQNPTFASLRLADGPLFLHEFPAAPRARHVVLSACDVGRSRVRPGDEPLGFAAALLARGIPSVVAALAPVPDEVAARAMAEYHRQLADGLAASRALRLATEGLPGAATFTLFGTDWRAPGRGEIR